MTKIWRHAILPGMLTPAQLQQLRAADPGEAPNRLGRAMDLAGVTQVQIEEAAGISQPYISAILNGKATKLPVVTARKLAAFFGCAIEDLFPSQAA